MKQLLIKNWYKLVLVGLMVFFYMDALSEIDKKDRIIEDIKAYQEELKEEQTIRIDSLEIEVGKKEDRLKKLDGLYVEIGSKLKSIQNERIKNNRDTTTYSDSKLDSILANYKRPEQRTERRYSIHVN